MFNLSSVEQFNTLGWRLANATERWMPIANSSRSVWRYASAERSYPIDQASW